MGLCSITIDEFLSKVVSDYNNVFPKSSCEVILWNDLWTYITIDWYLSADISGALNSTRQNDMFHICFAVMGLDGLNKASVFPDKAALEIWNKDYAVKSELDTEIYGSQDLPFRDTTGNAEKLLNTLDKYLSILRDMIEQDLMDDKIHPDHIDIVKDRLNISETE